MGVEASLCRICGGPVNHDHYKEDGAEFSFDASHEWLKRVVATNGTEHVAGVVEDQMLKGEGGTEYFVGDGLGSGEYFALHDSCWQLLGKPDSDEAYRFAEHSSGWKVVAPFREQLFNFSECAKSDDSWVLLDPLDEAGGKNKERIEGIVKESGEFLAKKALEEAASSKSVPALIKKNDWGSAKTKEQRFLFRKGVEEHDDRSGYGKALLISKPYIAEANGMPKDFMESLLSGFMGDLQKVVEWKDCGVLTVVATGGGTASYLIYTNDAAECEKRVRTIGDLDSPQPSEITVEDDGDWDHFFTSPHL